VTKNYIRVLIAIFILCGSFHYAASGTVTSSYKTIPVMNGIAVHTDGISISTPSTAYLYPEVYIERIIKMTQENFKHKPVSKHWGKCLLARSDPLVTQLEIKLRQYNLIYRADIQSLLKSAYLSPNESVRQFAVSRLQAAVDAYETKIFRQPDSLKPYGPPELLTQGQLHLLDQMDGIPWLIPIDTPLTGLLILGPQQGGKSRFIIQLCLEIQKANPNVVITILDPKNGFTNYAHLLDAANIDLSGISFGISRVPGVDYRDIVLELMPPLADTAGLIYGLEILNESATITLSQLEKYIALTGDTEAEICLKDIYIATSLVSQASSGRRSGYREAAQTALRRIIGEKELFACRKGVSMEWLFSRNSIINARCLTDDMQCRFLAQWFLYWKYQFSRYKSESNQLEHLIIIDDSSRFVGTAGEQFESSTRTSPLGHILALLRSTGTGLAAATQLPAYIDPAVLALSRTMVVVGGMSGAKHLKVITDGMMLNDEQSHAITTLNRREAVGFAPGTAYKAPVHGWVPLVADTPDKQIISVPDQEIPIQQWHNLAEIPTVTSTTTVPQAVEPATPQKTNITGMSQQAEAVAYDCVQSPYHSIVSHIKRLGLSGGIFEKAKLEAIEAGFLQQSSAGKTSYLIPATKAFEAFGIDCPYKRAVSIEHAFYVGLCVFLLQKDPRYKTVGPEIQIGNQGSTADVVVTCNDGSIHSWEITLNTSHCLANAVKYQNTAFATITFLCRDYNLKEAVKKFFVNSGIDTKLLAKINYMHISQLLEQERKLFNY